MDQSHFNLLNTNQVGTLRVSLGLCICVDFCKIQIWQHMQSKLSSLMNWWLQLSCFLDPEGHHFETRRVEVDWWVAGRPACSFCLSDLKLASAEQGKWVSSYLSGRWPSVVWMVVYARERVCLFCKLVFGVMSKDEEQDIDSRNCLRSG